MTFNPLWRYVENFDGAELSISTSGALSRGAINNLHKIVIHTGSSSLISAMNDTTGSTIAIFTSRVRNFFGVGTPLVENGTDTLATWAQNNAEWRITNMGSGLSQVDFIPEIWYPFESGDRHMTYYGDSVNNKYTVQIRNKSDQVQRASATITVKLI